MSQGCIQVLVTGEVKNNQTYSVIPGTPLKDLIKKVALKKTADTRFIDKKRILYCSQEVHIRKTTSCNEPL